MSASHAHAFPAHDDDRPLLPVDEVRNRILDVIEPLEPVEVGLSDAFGRVLTADVRASLDLPPFPSSAMDGFAVRAADLAEATEQDPTSLRIAGEVRMGHASEVGVGPGEAVAIPTGGAVPEGADALVPMELCVVEPGRVLVLAPVPKGRHVRPAGEDVRAGDLLVASGRRLLGPELGLLASAGVAAVPVRPAPRVAVLSTGDELVRPPEPLGQGQIYDANSFTLQGAVAEAGAIPIDAGRLPDDPARVVAALDGLAGDVDVFLSSGGVAMGELDPVKRAFAGSGEVDLYEVAMQPGKPQAFGARRGRPFFGLPGNPVSVFVSFEVFVRPALMKMMGREPLRPEITAVLDADIEGLFRKTRFARVHVRREQERLVAAPTGGHQSNLLATLSRADGLAVIPAGVPAARAGEPVSVILFRDPEEL